jgi:hypothetical protein
MNVIELCTVGFYVLPYEGLSCYLNANTLTVFNYYLDVQKKDQR